MKYFNFLLLIFLLNYSCSNSNEINENKDEDIDLDLGEEIVAIDFPDKFVNQNTSLHVVLSDHNGNPLDVKTYSKVKETLKLYTQESVNDNTQFSLTFINVVNDLVYNIYVYSNLTKPMLDGGIQFKPIGYATIGGFVNIETQNLNIDVLNAAGTGYSMIKINNLLSGHYTSKFNEDLGSKNIFIKYVDPTDIINNSYRWMFVDNIGAISLLSENNFRTDSVNVAHLQTNVPSQLPLLTLLGYENEILYNQISGHQAYSDFVPAFGYGSNHYYSYANIFEKTSYSLCYSNYSLSGAGIPPAQVTVPEARVSSTFSNNTLTFSGVEGFEVGRIRLDNSSLFVNIEFIFNGNSSEVTIPKIPDALVSENIKGAINTHQLRLVQAIAENYDTFNDYNQYINNVLKNSSPFYLSSPKRERICNSYISHLILPVVEFPYLERFR
ncbi:hypothetical protein ACFO5O_05790 [Geojedonia litorea]|uniref:Uncharacterized protein n=1 Tax=Geojedonia litorea TaxID=1268269 RepID=A0ABV9N0J9_9FLAO